MDTYNVFISWSGERSKKVAVALYDWLPMVLQTARPWMSKEDIEKGSRGLEEIGRALETMSVGIICLTPENVETPWVLFEAGALSNAMGEKTRICPYLFGSLRPENVKPPLGVFQGAMAVKDDTWKMVRTVNRVLGDSLTEEKLDTLFERMWPELQKNLGEIPDVAGAAVPVRSEKEMMAEVLELVRAAAGSNTNVLEALGLLAARMREVLDQVKPHVPLSALATGLPTWWEANALATRRVARLSDLAGTAAAASSSAGGVGEPNMSPPGSPAVRGQIAVPQPSPAASLMREGGEKREQKRERSHRPLISRKGAKEKRKEGQS